MAVQPMTNPPRQPAELLARAWQDLRASEPKLRIRDAAERLGVAEATLRATECGTHVTRLVDDWQSILHRTPLLGEVMALTRNESAVHEKVGEYPKPSFHGAHGLVLGQAIDLRLFPGRWAHGFLVVEGDRPSLHFFDEHGDAVHKIYAREGSEVAEFYKLGDVFRADDQRPELACPKRPVPAAEQPDTAIDGDGFRQAWLGMRDTHEFFGILRQHAVTRTQALRLAPDGHAHRVANDALDHVLSQASATSVPIMVFVGNPGCIQIHTGPVSRIVPMGPWINVLDPGFNLHLRRDHVDQAWVVRKPTEDGIVTSLELFDRAGETIAMVFGERKPGRPELPEWSELLASLTTRAEP